MNVIVGCEKQNPRHLRKCIIMLSLDAPFRMGSTRPRLSQKSCTLFLLRNLPHTEQLKTIATSYLTIMVIGFHSGGQGELEALISKSCTTAPCARGICLYPVIQRSFLRVVQKTDAISGCNEQRKLDLNSVVSLIR